MWWNPFYEAKIIDNQIIILNLLTNQQKIAIKSANTSQVMDTIINPLLHENTNIEDFLKQFPDEMKGNIKKLIKSLEGILLEKKKEKTFYENLLSLIKRVKEEFPGLDIERITEYMETTVASANAVIIYDEKQYSEMELMDAFPFENINAIELHEKNLNNLKQRIANMNREDWIIVLTDRFENKVLRDLDKEIVANNHFIFLSENQPNSEKISLGPILIPRCTGGVNQMLENKCRKESVPFPAEVKKSDKKGIEEKLISKYMYEEILKFAIDRYSNYATEYSKLLGTQYELNYQEEVIQRKEFIISEEWL